MMESRFYSILVTISNIFVLNILWLICCIPIITIFPATTAMFGVVRQWIIHKDTSVFQPFFRIFKSNFKTSFLIGLLWMFIAFFLYMDYTISLNLGFMQKIIPPMVFVVSFFFLFVSVFLFPTMVHYEMTFKETVKNSLFLSLIYFPITLLNLFLIGLCAFIVYILPITALFIFSITAYLIYFICQFVFEKVERQKQLKKVTD
nr:DUF624 domain-containing protein [Neobacillus sp. Marseille-Q6967]